MLPFKVFPKIERRFWASEILLGVSTSCQPVLLATLPLTFALFPSCIIQSILVIIHISGYFGAPFWEPDKGAKVENATFSSNKRISIR